MSDTDKKRSMELLTIPKANVQIEHSARLLLVVTFIKIVMPAMRLKIYYTSINTRPLAGSVLWFYVVIDI